MKTIEQEKNDAEAKYGHFNSTHEVYAVLLEEVDEFWELVKKPAISENIPEDIRRVQRDNKSRIMIHELTQIAAIAQRAISELENNQIRWI
jgi:c-di-GMP-binding flagellar brake protein YcgR